MYESRINRRIKKFGIAAENEKLVLVVDYKETAGCFWPGNDTVVVAQEKAAFRP